MKELVKATLYPKDHIILNVILLLLFDLMKQITDQENKKLWESYEKQIGTLSQENQAIKEKLKKSKIKCGERPKRAKPRRIKCQAKWARKRKYDNLKGLNSKAKDERDEIEKEMGESIERLKSKLDELTSDQNANQKWEKKSAKFNDEIGSTSLKTIWKNETPTKDIIDQMTPKWLVNI